MLKYTKRPSLSEAEVIQEPVHKPAPIKERKKKERPYRAFQYRGIAFFHTQKGEESVLQVLDRETNRPGPAITVPKNSAKQATKALAKIVIAEAELASLGVKVD